MSQKAKPPYVPQPNLKRRQLAKTPGVSVKMIPENKENDKSPELKASQDPFADWF